MKKKMYLDLYIKFIKFKKDNRGTF